MSKNKEEIQEGQEFILTSKENTDIDINSMFEDDTDENEFAIFGDQRKELFNEKYGLFLTLYENEEFIDSYKLIKYDTSSTTIGKYCFIEHNIQLECSIKNISTLFPVSKRDANNIKFYIVNDNKVLGECLEEELPEIYVTNCNNKIKRKWLSNLSFELESVNQYIVNFILKGNYLLKE